jgi:cytochrome c oxidase subunit 2
MRWPGCCIAFYLLLGGCSANPSIFHPAGPGAATIGHLTWLFIAVGGTVYLITVGVFLAACRRRENGISSQSRLAERYKIIAVAAALFVTAAILTVLVGASYVTDRALIAQEKEPSIEIELTAHQWWWEIRYHDQVPSKGFVTANELHLPLGRTARITLSSADVIHSLWLPNVTGKRDIIPGRSEEIFLTVTEPGTWIGRCAEFCGYQHAHMALRLIAENADSFDAWRAAQAAPAQQPQTDEEKRGEQVFAQASCVLCHVIRGSAAGGYSATAPDLTHLKSRTTIAAGTLPNRKGYLAGWIADPQSQKPGVRMPVNMLPPGDFQALVTYLESLK